MLKIMLIIAFAAHVLCGVTDCLLGYGRKGRIDLKCLRDSEKMAAEFAHMPASFPMASMLLGTLAITLMTFGYLGLAWWMDTFSRAAAIIMFISAIVLVVPIVTHHVFCGVVEWFYLRLGRTAEARELVFDFQKKTSATMIVGYLALAVFAVTLFVVVVSGQTALPRWACLFNTLPLMLILAPTKLPAKGNIAGAVMFLGLAMVI